MAIYIVTASNWNSAAFWSGITETGTGHTLDFSALDATYSVSVNQTTGVVTIVNGFDGYTVGEAGVTGVNANFGGTTLLDYFTTISGAQSGDQVTGSAEDELLDGNSGDDRMEGMAGNDTFYGNGGADQMDGGDGADILYGGSGGDELYGGTGADQIFGESDNDTIDAESGDDFVNGGAGADLIFGGDGADQLEGGYEDDSADTIYAGTGNDLVFGGGGDDSIFGEAGLDYLDGQAGNDYIDGGLENDRILGDLGSDTIFGGGSYDTLTGGEGADLINGGSDGDHIYGNAGDTIDGGETGDDFDTLYVSYVDFITYSTAESGTVTFNSGDTLTFTGIEQVVTLSNDGIVQGTAGGDQIGQFYFDADGDWVDNGDAIGEGDGDSIRAGDGNDTVWSNDGDDTVHGEGGNDRINLGGGNNVAFGGAGADTINGEWQNDTISGDDFIASGPNLIVNGSFEDTTGMTTTGWGFSGAGAAPGWTDGNGFAVEFHNDGRGGLTATDGSNWLDLEANPGQQNIVSQTVAGVQDGQVYVLTFDAADLSDINDGTTQDNQLQVIWNGDVVGTIDASDGSWRNYEFHLIGGSGNGSNTLVFQGLGDVSGVGASIDNVQLYEGLEAAGDADSIVGGDGNDDLMGGSGDDTIDAGNGADEVVGGSGNDYILAGAGNDKVYGGTGQDTILDGAGDDLVYGGDGNDVVYGGDGADTFSGNFGADEILGGDGADNLQGGQGNDTLQGGNDNDTLLGDGQWFTVADYASGGGAATNLTIINSADGPIELWWIDGTGTAQQYATIQPGDTFVQPTFEDHNWVLRDSDGYWLELIEGAPNQTVNYGAEGLDDSLDGGAGNDILTGQFGNDTLLGGDGLDTLFGGDGNDSINGGSGADSLLGQAGNDTIVTGTGQDTVFGGAGNDSILANTGANDKLVYGEDGADTIFGSSENDTLDGGADADVIYAGNSFGLGNNSITGGETVTTGTDFDTIDLSTLTTGVTATYSGGEAGTITDGTDTTTFSEIERLVLTDQADVVNGGGGNEVIDAGGGDDTVSTGTGNDSILGGAGNDFLEGGAGNDTLDGGAGNDRFFSSEGADTIIGGTGRDTYFASDGFDGDVVDLGGDAITINNGNAEEFISFFNVTTSVDIVYTSATGGTATSGAGESLTFDNVDGWEGAFDVGGTFDASLAGFDVTFYDYGGMTSVVGSDYNDFLVAYGADPVGGPTDRFYDGGAGNDTIDTGIGNDTILGGIGDDDIVARAGDDVISGGTGADTMRGGDDADTFITEDNFGNDVIVGGEGVSTGTDFDTIDLSAVSSSVTVNFTAAETGTITDGTDTITFSEIERLVLTDQADVVNGGGGNEVIDAGGGDDTVSTGTGNDSILGGAGNDSLIGGDGNDTVDGGAGDDYVAAFTGDDSLSGGDGNDDIFSLGGGNDTLDGGADADLISVMTMSNTTVTGGETVTTGTDDDTLNAGAGVDMTLNVSGAESGTITNGAETITYSGIEAIRLGSGNDTVEAGTESAALNIDAGGGDDLFNAASTSGDNTFEGQSGNDTIFGGSGNETLGGGSGNDQIFGGAGNDSIHSGGDADTVEGGLGNDTIDGAQGDDLLDGGDGADLILGGDGADTMSGGAGSDQLVGGGDADTFVFADGFGADTVSGGDTATTGTDFDTLDFSQITTGGVNVTYSANEAGTATEGTNSVAFTEIEAVTLTNQADMVDASASTADVTVSGLDGNDSITGGSGADTLLGGDGADTLNGGAGDDLIQGDNTAAIITNGGFESDQTGWTTVDPETGWEDTYLGNGSTNKIFEMDGVSGQTTVLEQDFTVTEAGSTSVSFDAVVRTAGTVGVDGFTVEILDDSGAVVATSTTLPTSNTTWDTYSLDAVLPAAGTYTLRFTEVGDDNGMGALLDNVAFSSFGGADSISAGDGNDTVLAGDGNDMLDGGAGNDLLSGGAGNDYFESDAGADTIIGGTGIDQYWVSGGFDGDVVDLGGDEIDNTTMGYSEYLSFDLLNSTTNIVFTSGTGGTATSGTGDSLTFDNVDGFEGGAASGGSFDARLADFDVSFFDYGGTTLVYGSAYDDELNGQWGSSVDRFIDGGAGDDYISSAGGSDTLIGGAGNDSILGGAGNDFLEGGAGSDTLYGGLGQDTLVGGAGGDFLQGDQDSDLADYSDSDAAITIVLDGGGAAGFAAGGHAENDTIVGIDELIGSDFNDSLTGYDATHHGTLSNIIDGGAGDDTIDGLGGNDILIGGVGNDSVLGGAGNDALTGSEGADSLLGQDGDDLLIGDGPASTTGGQFGIFALASAGTTGILNNGTFVFDSSAASTDVQVTDDETAFEDLNNSSGSTLDAGAPQVLTQDITIGSSTYLAGTSIHAIAQSDIVNETTGETGNAWLVQLGPTLAGHVYWSFDIAVNNGDQITWTSSNTPGVQDQVYANTTGLEYIDLVQADGQFLASNDTLVGGIGNDTLIGGVGDDSLVAGDGADSISGDGGSDFIDAGTGSDTVDAGDGNDQVFAWTGDDSVLGGAGSDTVFGQDGNDTIFGGIGNDYLDGDDAVAGADSIFGEDGDDTIIGDGGNDTLSGGSGNDQIFAGADDDIVVGGTGNDQLYGEGGNDSLDAGAGNDTVLGGDGNDTIIGFEGNDSVLGGAGDDVINTRTSPGTGLPDEGYGAIGNPLYYPADSDAFNDRDTVDGGIGNDSILTGDDNDVILGGDGADTVDAGFDDDEVYGDAGADSLEGNEGNDTISGGADGDVIYGDVSPTNPDYPFYTPYELVNDGTDLAPNNNADVLSGDGGNDTIYGQDDNDTISGGLGDDEIYGGIDNDSVTGDDGSDTIDGGAGTDYIDGGTGADLLYGGTGDLIGPNLIADGSFEGATPTSPGQVNNLPDWYNWNTASPDLSDDTGYEPTYSSSAAPTDGTNYVSIVSNGSGFQEGISQDLATPLVAGTTYTITLDAAAGGYNNTSPLGDNLQILLFGNETAGQVAGDSGLPPGVQLLGSADVTTDYNTGTMGTITISFTPTTDIATLSLSLEDPDFSGGFAVLTIDNVSLQENTALPGDNDTIIGGTGDDTIFGQDGDDSLSGGADNDIVDGGIGNDWLSGNSGNDTVRGGDGADSVFGAEGDDVMYGDAGNDSMEGWIGNDSMFGGTGDDYIDGAIGADSLEGGDGNDTLLGGSDVGNDTLRGGLGDDSLSAGGGDDVLDGGDGADILFAADGNDQLDGGAGNDTLDGWTGNDTITAGTGDDQITGGDGDDTFIYVAGDGVDTITDFNFGNSGTLNDGDITNNDRIDLSNFYDDIWELTADFNDDGILNQSNDGVGDVDYSNNASLGGGGLVFAGATGNMSSFTVENTGVVCFASGTRILTTEGERLIETLRVGDRIITRDNGVQTLRWIGKRDLSKTDLARNPKLHPIHLSPKLTGGDLPLIVSPQHGVVFNVDGEETLVRAIHLARLQGGAARVMHGCRKVSYFHIMFEDHQIVFANGAPSESFFPGHFALAALESDVRSEIYELFPDLQHHAAEQSYGMQARSFARFSHLPDHLNALRGRSRHRSVPGAAIAAHAHRPNAVTQRQAAS